MEVIYSNYERANQYDLRTLSGINLMRNPLSGRNPRVSSLVIRNPVNKRNESFTVTRPTAGGHSNVDPHPVSVL